ncbi:MAG: GNAT family N-acetyltransferase [Desulfobacterales bacterium]|nr:GNAT family N-acetyltransferase [Desulfobacterales bacterium]
MNSLPTLTTDRLRLRPFDFSDGPQLRRMAGDRRIADTTVNIPHPYDEGMAETWIATHRPEFEAGRQVNLAITLGTGGILIGAVGLVIEPDAHRGDLGYWIGVPHWGRGYCTEAGRAVLRYAFSDLLLNRVTAYHFTRNPASGRVMEKLGMHHEGCLRRHLLKWEQYEDLELYGILAREWRAALDL